MAKTIMLEVRCIYMSSLLPDTEFGLQDKDRVLHAGEAQADGTLVFRCEAKLNQKAGSITLSGAFVHGTGADRFLYLGLRPLGGAMDAWIRRWKVPLPTLDAEMLQSGLIACKVEVANAVKTRFISDGWQA